MDGVDENQRERVRGDERDRLLEAVSAKTDFDELDDHIQDRGYRHTRSIVQRGTQSEEPFDLYQVIQFYRKGDAQATATWIGLDPKEVERGTASYDMIDISETASSERGSPDDPVYPVIVGFLDEEEIGLQVTAAGIEENKMELDGFANVD